MSPRLSHAVALGSIMASVGVLGVASCTHTATDRVLEPESSDASTTSPSSPLADAGATPIGPIATAVEPAPDFHTVRAPEFGLPATARLAGSWDEAPAASGQGGTGGTGPVGGASGRGGGIFR
jgi:hypothetical protein